MSQHKLNMIFNPYFKWKYLSKDQLAGFDRYKYKSIDTSPISNYITHPFWNFVVQFFPLWLAPNLITFIGWLLVLSIFLIDCYYDPHFKAGLGKHTGYHIPPLCWVWFAIAQFASHTLDGTDGKQARRTNSSSPLGELFDHGLDSSAVWLITLGLFSVFGYGEGSATVWELYLIYIVCLIGFYLAHWEKYNTGILNLPWAYDSSQLSITAVYFITFLLGTEFWKTKIDIFSLQMQYSDAARFGVYASSAFITFPVCARSVYVAHATNSGRGVSLIEGLAPFLPLAVLMGMFSLWAVVSPSDVLHNQSRLFMTALGIVYSNITCRLIVSTMCNQRCERFNNLLYPLAVVLLLVPFLHVGGENTVLALYTLIACVLHIHYGVGVVNELCDHLRIRCFSLKKL